MGGKGSSGGSVPTAYPPPQQDYMALFAPIMQMMGQMTKMSMDRMNEAMEQMATPSLPDMIEYKEIDWAKRQEQLYNKAKGELALEKARRFGREDTILTSPLLDDEEAITTSPLVD